MPPLLLTAAAFGWLLAWHYNYPDLECAHAVIWIAPLVAIIALGMLEGALYHRRALLGMYLRERSWLFILLKGGLVLVVWQVIKALFFAALLLIESPGWGPQIWFILGLDALLIVIAHALLRRLFTRHVRSGFDGVLTRQLLVTINTLLLVVAIVYVELHSEQLDYREMGLLNAMRYGAAQVQGDCDAIAAAVRVGEAKRAGGWYLAQRWLGESGDRGVALAGWLLFLLASVGFVWGYSRLLLGILINPLALFDRLASRPEMMTPAPGNESSTESAPIVAKP